MFTSSRPRTAQPLSRQDKTTIATVLTWDLRKPITPEEVEAIRVRGEWVAVHLSCDRAVPIHREVFRSILQQQQA